MERVKRTNVPPEFEPLRHVRHEMLKAWHRKPAKTGVFEPYTVNDRQRIPGIRAMVDAFQKAFRAGDIVVDVINADGLTITEWGTSDEALAGVAAAQLLEMWNAGRGYRLCRNCAVVFFPRRSSASFCSIACRNAWNNRRRVRAMPDVSKLTPDQRAKLLEQLKALDTEGVNHG